MTGVGNGHNGSQQNLIVMTIKIITYSVELVLGWSYNVWIYG